MVQLFIAKAKGSATAPVTVTLSPLSAISLTVGTPFTRTFVASGGTSPYAYAVASGALPAGLSLNSSTGVLSGTPTVAGAFSFGIRATDAASLLSLIGVFAGTIASSSATLNSALAPPILTLISANTDGSSPVLNVGLDSADYSPGDTLRIYQRNKAGTLINTFTHVVTLAEATDTSGGTDGRVPSLLSSVAAGTWRFTADILRAVNDYGPLSIVLIEGPDDIAPTLSLPTKTSIVDTGATLGCTTDEGNGTLYYVVTTTNSAPSVAQIVAGQNAAGTTAAASGNQAISSTGAKNFAASGLTASTAYYVWFMQKDATGNASNVLPDTFTTAAPSMQALGNPGFDTDTVWSKGSGMTISGGTANSAGGVTSLVGQSALTVGGVYSFSFDYQTGFTSGGKLRLDNSNNTGGSVVYTSAVLNADGAWHTLTGSFTASNSWIWLQADSAAFDVGKIDNFTCTRTA